jgi:acetyl-CoA carboxylase biotin carboxyl carrier protein
VRLWCSAACDDDGRSGGSARAAASGVGACGSACRACGEIADGRVYRSSSPSAKAFVEVGSVVRRRSDLHHQAMKILNETESKVGTITKILAENGQAVEYGQPLFMIE